jgi:hypothetical protein
MDSQRVSRLPSWLSSVVIRRDPVAWATVHARHTSRWAAHLYQQARRRDKCHPQAIRILMRAWLRVIWACWHTGRPYDSNHHRADQRLAQEPAA